MRLSLRRTSEREFSKSGEHVTKQEIEGAKKNVIDINNYSTHV
jgi:hypothetical protein